MNGIQALLSEPWVERLSWTLLHFLWQGTAIAILHTALRFLLARTLSPQTRYLLACGALLAMAVAPPLTFLTISNGAVTAPQAATSLATPEAWTLSASEWKWLPPVIVALWVAGVFGFSIRLFGAFRFTQRLRATSHPVPAEWQQTLEQIAVRMGRPLSAGARQVRLVGSSLVNVPAVIGHLKPLILVPVEFLTGLPAEHVVALLAHEMAHIRRNDYLASVLQSFAEVALFYHPAVWWISGQIRAERELCCDDLVIAAGTDVLTYARALTELESRRPAPLRPQVAANGGSLMDRIRRLIEPAHIGAHYLPGTASAWAMILLWLVGAGVTAVTGAQKPVAPSPAHLAAAFLPEMPDRIPLSPGHLDNPLASLVGQAQKTLLYDPVLPTQLAQLQPAPGVGIAQQQASARPPALPANPLVVEHVTVKNDSGGIVEGLRKEDFTVLDDGNTQDISLFEFENVERLATAPPLVVPNSATALPALVRTGIAPETRGQLRYRNHRLIALYFDTASLPVPDQLRALEAARRFVAAQMSPADVLCLMQYTGTGVEVLQDFTGDRNRLLSIIATMEAGVTDVSAVPATTVEAEPGFSSFNADRKLAALRTAAKMLGSLKEKKALVYFSGGLKLSAADNQAPLRAAIVEAVRSGVSVWPIVSVWPTVSVWPIDVRAAVSAQPAAAEQDALNSLGSGTRRQGDVRFRRSRRGHRCCRKNPSQATTSSATPSRMTR